MKVLFAIKIIQSNKEMAKKVVLFEETLSLKDALQKEIGETEKICKVYIGKDHQIAEMAFVESTEITVQQVKQVYSDFTKIIICIEKEQQSVKNPDNNAFSALMNAHKALKLPTKRRIPMESSNFITQ